MAIPEDKNAAQAYYAMMMDSLPMAYVCPVMTDKGKKYAVRTSDGTDLAFFDTQDAAYFAAKQNDLDPMLIN